jgi:RNA polymerase sigma-70 factor (ECF subfamily)
MTGSRMSAASSDGAGADDEARLIARSRRGDAVAFSELVAIHQGRVRAYIAGSISRADVVDDLAQEVFLGAFRKLDSYKGDAPLGVWLLGIARHKALMFLRGELRRLARESGSVEAVLAPFKLGLLEGDEGELQRREQEIAALQSCLESLPPSSAGMIADRYFNARSIADMARDLGKGEGAIRMTLLRLRQALRACVQARLAKEGGV